MLIDSLSIKYSAARGQRVVPLQQTQPTSSHSGRRNQADIINTLHSLLTSVGWTAEGLPATSAILYPFGFLDTAGSVAPAVKGTVGCRSFPWVTVGDVGFTVYNPITDNPLANATCIMVELGATAGDSLANLAAAISGASPFNASVGSVGSDLAILLEAKVSGPDANHYKVIGDGRLGVAAGDSGGGGYTFTSAAGASEIQVSVVSTGNIFAPQRLDFNFLLNDGPAQYQLDVWNGTEAIEQYTMLANPHSFAIFDNKRFPSPSAVGRQATLYCAAPYIPVEEGFQDAYAAFVVGPGGRLRTRLYWASGASTALDGPAKSYSDTGGWPRVLARRSPQFPLLTPAGKPDVTTAWVMFGPDRSTDPTVVGKLFDCAVINDQVDEGIFINGQKFLTISSQDGANGQTKCSLVMRIQ